MLGHSMPTDPGFLRAAPHSLGAWVGVFDVETLPVLGKTVFEIEDWRAHEDQVDAHLLAEFVARDPLMTVKLFAHLAQMRPGREDSVPETVTGCLLMLGIPPFFTRFQALVSVDEHFAAEPAALDGLMAVLDRSRRAADFALSFAVHRMDHDAQLIYSAALLHELAEMLLWLKAPGLAREIVRRQGGDQQLRSADAQRDVLHITLSQLQQELMRRWHFPAALTSLIDLGTTAHSAQARNVELAARIARHSSSGWDNPAIPDDVRDIADFLQIGLEPTKHLLHEIDS